MVLMVLVVKMIIRAKICSWKKSRREKSKKRQRGAVSKNDPSFNYKFKSWVKVSGLQISNFEDRNFLKHYLIAK